MSTAGVAATPAARKWASFGVAVLCFCADHKNKVEMGNVVDSGKRCRGRASLPDSTEPPSGTSRDGNKRDARAPADIPAASSPAESAGAYLCEPKSACMCREIVGFQGKAMMMRR